MSKQTLVSVIIPTYNRSRTIGAAIDSVRAQTWPILEIIVVDDGSTDDTASVLAPYGDSIRVIRQKNQGASAARNTGIAAATGEIVSFLDSDNIWLPRKTERQVELMHRTRNLGVVCCVCNAEMVPASGPSTTSFKVADLKPQCEEGVWRNPAEVLLTRFLFFNQVVAVWRSVLDEVGLFNKNLKILEDYDLALRLAKAGPWAFIAEPLVVWRGGAENSLSNSADRFSQDSHTYEILSNLASSPSWPAVLGPLTARRRKFVGRSILARKLLGSSKLRQRSVGRMLLLWLRLGQRLSERLPGYPRMQSFSA